MPLSPDELLALSLQQYKGMFALLVGSGISRSAGIPTGWEIVLDLINRLASSKGQDAPEDPVAWYRAEFNREPDYSDIINAIAATREQRVQLLRQYFEPTEEEREEGLKQPTAAHRAIARLVSGGFVKVIITTNFDRLLERAIEEEGITPAIVAGPDAAEGLMPLQHLGCLIFKIHGDYFDTRIRNVTDELEQYDPPTTALLDRIVSEYGLVICGWSGIWDIALGDSVLRNAHIRFPTFWLSRGDVTDRAQLLFDHRRATLVEVESADKSLPAIAERTAAIEATSATHPHSVDITIALAKRYLSRPEPHIELHDLIMQELDRSKSRFTPASFSTHRGVKDDQLRDLLKSREAQYREGIKPFIGLAVETIKYGSSRDIELVYRSIKAIATKSREQEAGDSWLIDFQGYPACLMLYAAGLAAVMHERYDIVYRLFQIPIDSTFRSRRLAGDILFCSEVMPDRLGEYLLGVEKNDSRRKTPASDWMAAVLPDMLRRQLGGDVDYVSLQNRFELISSLSTRQHGGYTQPGRFLWFGGRGETRLVDELAQELSEQGAGHALFVSGVLVNDQETLDEALQALRGFANRISW